VGFSNSLFKVLKGINKEFRCTYIPYLFIKIKQVDDRLIKAHTVKEFLNN